MDGSFSVPVAAFSFAHGGPRIDTPPPTLGQHNEEIVRELRDEPRVARMKR
jgi:crotonobetainyl-CoA:carnitine CoA-transferase CaiB-like acyl-CoA transferase